MRDRLLRRRKGYRQPQDQSEPDKVVEMDHTERNEENKSNKSDSGVLQASRPVCMYIGSQMVYSEEADACFLAFWMMSSSSAALAACSLAMARSFLRCTYSGTHSKSSDSHPDTYRSAGLPL